ncbi:probably inactive leucine-rich repeat receptor-like protein kinase At3g28040 [Cynara cardunculus var. scolymus]|uniref:probably inactive leucine-rich repeat receptor-like protein kinase At3g28040 n=1 Tax=Cynara cardunculus var. scolymus TaxID=59895 RepID=UPI000D624506|nr:probably inactive leucine-rich repeat receptor-like protein kinase At3g28040 [Cynara cardunculus var. scolymus]
MTSSTPEAMLEGAIQKVKTKGGGGWESLVVGVEEVSGRQAAVMGKVPPTYTPQTLLANSFAINADQSLNLNDEVLGLIVFKSYLTDPSSHLSSWNQDDDTPCSWRFITCNPATGRVTGLSLDGLNLSGKIGRGLEKLQNLKVLSLARNNFTGNLNPELSLLTNLQRLNLSRNGFSDRIPGSLMNSGSIKFLDLSENSLSGPVTEELFVKCLSLRMLSLSGNNLEGPIPNSLLKCTSLNHLNLSNNRFSGNPINSGLWSLTRIRTMDLSRNMFSGSLPNGIFALHDLKELSLEGNHFTGALPSGIGLCPHLNKLDLSNNLFTEAIPEFQALSSLNYLNLANNILTGEFPQWIGSLTSLEYLDFSGNDLTGTLPESMGDLRSLSYVSLSDNRLSGSIPLSLVSSSKLSVIRLRGNKFNGSIPDGLFELGLDLVDFSRNELTGSIPPGSSRLFENLQSLDLSANRLTGDIPAEIGLNSRLRYLNLSWNNFETKMPPELGYFQNLTVLDLRNGAFHGFIPADLCDSGSLGILQLDGNSFTGSIPDDIGNCSSLYLLSVSHNSLSGSIPRSMSLLKKLKILKLEYNQLSGEIPPELGGLENLLSVNISYNRLQGRLPTGGIFQSLQQSSLEGNLGICSPLLKGPCKMNVPKPLVLDPFAYGNENGRHQGGRGGEGADQSSRSLRHHRFLSVSAIIAILAAIMISIGVLVISLLNISARRRLAFVDNAIESCSSSSRSGPSLSMGRLVWFDSKTDPNWVVSPESFLKKAAEIGEGVFGSVYKASLGEENGSDNILAIKNLVVSNMIQYPEDFDREVRVLGRVRHPNLVSLKGYYWTPKLQLLVTDYVPNGSLQTKLHDRPPSSPPLSWPNRFKILLGTAKGLAHLHHFFRPPIVHYNIKPNNILLDDNLNAKISDFGLTRLVSKLDKHVMSNRFQSALGYVAPELACQSLRVNEKCDVYGFGVLILEIVTGRRPIEYGEDNVLILNEQVKVMLEEGSVLQCVDESMGEYPEEEVLPVLKLALVCTSQIPSSRPSMAEIVQILQVIKTPIPQPF